MKIKKISPQENNFTQILTNIAKTPKTLYFIGTLPESRQTTIAIVGSRRPTSYGKEITYQLAYELAQYGIIIVSGLALGVDGVAHRATLDAQGTTIAVLANSVDSIYPATHRQLAQDIVNSGGMIVSEYKPPTEARGYQFLERNRLISGLSNAVIVTEAALRSGTLSTVNHALEQGREVFVVPGNITSPLSAGCNNLIKQGAHPITCTNDVLEIVAPDLLKEQKELPLGNTPLETTIIKLLSSGIRDGEQLQSESKAPIEEFLNTITMMEINGIIRPLGGNQWTLK